MSNKTAICVISHNKHKIKEIKKIAKSFDIKIRVLEHDLDELQTNDREKLIRYKTLQAFNLVGLPVLVDHAALEIKSLNNMPGSFTQVFWENLGSKICDITMHFKNQDASAISKVGFCDGKNIYTTEKIVKGKISEKPKGSLDFDWDSIFIPNGQSKTYAEMSTDEKNNISQRKFAFEAQFQYIKDVLKWV